MNWETQQICHAVAGNFNHKDYLHFSAMGDDIYTTAHFNEEQALTKLAEEIEEFFFEHKPVSTGVYGELLTGTMEEVDWREVAESVLEGVMGMYI